MGLKGYFNDFKPSQAGRWANWGTQDKPPDHLQAGEVAFYAPSEMDANP